MAYASSQCGRMIVSGANDSIVLRSSESGIVGLPQSRPCENCQSSVTINPATPAALARSSRSQIRSRVPHQ